MFAATRSGLHRSPVGSPRFLQGELPSRWRAPFERSFGRSLAQVRVVSGPDVDADLAARQALGRALAPDRIALASAVADLPLDLQFFVVGHELAHTVQLALRGSSPVRDLEAEADRAALGALQGQSRAIRGRASEPLNVMTTAIAIVSKMSSKDKDLASASKHYFDTFRFEPSGGKIVGKTPGPGKGGEAFRWLSIYWNAQELANINLLDVLTKAAEYALVPNGAVVIDCHGGLEGLSLPLVPGGKHLKVGLTTPTSVVDYLLCKHKKYSDEDAAYGLYLYELDKNGAAPAKAVKRAIAQLKTMRQKIDILRAKQLRHVAFRACQVGKNADALAGLKEMFGAERASAPKLRTFFGYLIPHIDEPAAKWNEIHGLDSKWLVFGTRPKCVALRLKGKDPSDEIECVADSKDAVTAFVQNYYPPTHNYVYKRGPLYYQVLWDPGTQRVYFPQEAEYVNNLLYDESAPRRPYAKLVP